jgi:hypothetical protein
MGDPGVRTGLGTRTARNPSDVLNPGNDLNPRSVLNLRNVLNLRSVQQPTSLRIEAQGAVRVGVQPAPALRLHQVVVIRNRTGRDS